MTMVPPQPTPPNDILFYHSEVVKYPLMVRNGDKKVSGASEAEKGSGPEEVKNVKYAVKK